MGEKKPTNNANVKQNNEETEIVEVNKLQNTG